MNSTTKAHRLGWALCAFLFIAGKTYGQSRHDLIGTWHDDSKATISITGVSHTGQLTGTYLSAVAAPHQFFQLIGWVSPVTTSLTKLHIVPLMFSVRWSPYGTVTVWTGYLSKAKDGALFITTIWSVVRADADPDSTPDSTTVNSTIFKPGPAH